jgi:signal peptidase I
VLQAAPRPADYHSAAVSRLKELRANPIVDGIITIASAILIAYVVQLLIVKPYRIPSESMVPTLAIGDRVITARFLLRFRDPERGEVFVFHPNGKGSDVFQPAEGEVAASSENYVKRVIGLPDETYGSLRGKVFICKGDRTDTAIVNGELNTGRCAYLNEPYVHGQPTTTCQGSADVPPTYIPPKYYLLLGDNRENSADGRCWGLIPRGQLIGRVFMTYWPLSRISFR